MKADHFAPEVQHRLKALLGRLHEEVPELAAVMNTAKDEGLSEDAAMAAAMDLIAEVPEVQAKFTALAFRELAPLRDPLSPDEIGDLAFQAPVGHPQMNPLMEAVLCERLQFDGDIPELRTGPLPPGTKAAVAVATNSRSAVAIGRMLEVASEKVTEATVAHDLSRKQLLEGVATQKGTALMERGVDGLVKSDPQVDELTIGSASTDLAAYRRGEVPAPVTVQAPTGVELVEMSATEKKGHAWKFLSTTTGRLSAVGTIRDLIRIALCQSGFDVKARETNFGSPESPVAHHRWEVSLGGRGSMQPAFNFIDTAAKAITANLKRNLDGVEVGTRLFLEVAPVNTVDVRSVGWAARLMRG